MAVHLNRGQRVLQVICKLKQDCGVIAFPAGLLGLEDISYRVLSLSTKAKVRPPPEFVRSVADEVEVWGDSSAAFLPRSARLYFYHEGAGMRRDRHITVFVSGRNVTFMCLLPHEPNSDRR